MSEEIHHQASISHKKSNQHLVATLIYLLDILQPIGILISLIFVLFTKKNTFVRFHALQSFLTFLLLFILGYAFAYVPMPYISRILRTLVGLVEIALWIWLMIKAYQNTLYKLPYIGNLAEALLKKVG